MEPAARRGLAPRLGALANPAFALIWAGALVSNIGSWMESVCQSWLVYDESGSELWSGLLQFGATLPAAILAIPVGLLADRLDRRRLVLLTQVGLALVATLQAVAAHLGLVQPPVVVAIALLAGVCSGAMVPCWHALVSELVPREHLGSAIALNGAQFNVARVLGPMFAGFIVQRFGMAFAFDLNVTSFALVILALAVVRTRGRERPAPRPWRAELAEGVLVARREPAVSRLIGLAFGYAVLGTPVLILLPAVARRLLAGEVGTFSHELSAMGTGAIAGAVVVGALWRRLSHGRVLAFGLVLTGVTEAAVAFSTREALSLGIIFLFGVAWCVTWTTHSTSLQLLTPDRLRGRIMSLSFSSFIVGAMVGPLAAGWCARTIDLTLTLACLGGGMTLLGAWQLVRPVAALEGGLEVERPEPVQAVADPIGPRPSDRTPAAA